MLVFIRLAKGMLGADFVAKVAICAGPLYQPTHSQKWDAVFGSCRIGVDEFAKKMSDGINSSLNSPMNYVRLHILPRTQLYLCPVGISKAVQ